MPIVTAPSQYFIHSYAKQVVNMRLRIEPYPKQVRFFNSTKRYIAYGV